MIKHILTLIWNKKRNNFLLFLEIFLAFIILFSVFTFVTVNLRSYNTPLGYDSDDVWAAYLEIDEGVDSLTMLEMKRRLKQELMDFPQVNAVAYSNSSVPFNDSNNAFGHAKNGFRLFSFVVPGDENYGEVMDLNAIEGRLFNETDAYAKQPSVLLTKGLVEEYFGDRKVVDSVFVMDDDIEMKVVGVIDAFRYHGEFSSEERVMIKFSQQKTERYFSALIELNGEVAPEFEEKINKTIAGVINRNDFVIKHLDTERSLNSREYWVPIIALFSICGFLILNIALGLFGVLWYNINKRRPEIGLRRTIGATKSSISWQFVLEIFFITTAGLLVGMFFAAQLPLLKLVDIENINYYYAMASSIGIILIVVLICAFYPSRQAAMIHPALALHEE